MRRRRRGDAKEVEIWETRFEGDEGVRCLGMNHVRLNRAQFHQLPLEREEG